MNEDRLKDILELSLKDDFILKKERKGKHLLEQRTIYVDFLLHPNEDLISKGFDPMWFGCEVKSPNVIKEPQKTVMDLAKQCIDYTESKIDRYYPWFYCNVPKYASLFSFAKTFNE